MLTTRNAAKTRHRSRGQAMVEFALVIPIFLTIFVAIAEFSFLFTSYLSVNYATHDAAQLAATLGNTPGVDAAVLERVNNDISTPADKTKIKQIDIYWVNLSSGDGSAVGGAITTYIYDGGSHAFTKPDGSTVLLPFSRTANGYPESSRCNVNMGVGCVSGHTTVDTLGVKITYQYTWITPFPNLITGQGTGPLLSLSNMMRLEPVL